MFVLIYFLLDKDNKMTMRQDVTASGHDDTGLWAGEPAGERWSTGWLCLATGRWRAARHVFTRSFRAIFFREGKACLEHLSLSYLPQK